MNKIKKIISSMLIILVFLCLILPQSNANFFTDDNNDQEDSEIIQTIDNDDGGIFEKIIAKMIGGIAETVLHLTTNDELGVGFKNYDELIFAKDSTDISPFTVEQWNSMMSWYGVMAGIAGSLLLIAIVVVSYKMITSSYSIEKRSEAKDSLMRLFFGVAAIGFAPLFIKFLLLINNNLVKMIIGLSNHNLEDFIGNSVVTNVQTGNAIATAIIIALFAYLFFKINAKFIIRQFTILIFTLFTPIISIMWMINKRTIGASIWFGQILINVFMQFIYAFLFLIYMEFLPQSGGWATSILWAMMILPLADTLQNTLQNLISRIAGINNDVRNIINENDIKKLQSQNFDNLEIDYKALVNLESTLDNILINKFNEKLYSPSEEDFDRVETVTIRDEKGKKKKVEVKVYNAIGDKSKEIYMVTHSRGAIAGFYDEDIRDNYKEDWFRANLKNKVISSCCVSNEFWGYVNGWCTFGFNNFKSNTLYDMSQTDAGSGNILDCQHFFVQFL